MEIFATAAALTISLALTLFCWRQILRSDDYRFFKIAFFIISAIPIVGPVFYFFSNLPPRHIRPTYRAKALHRAPSRVLQRWNEREHIYLTWAGIVFLSLAVLAWWINDWSPGQLRFGSLGVFTDVDTIFFGLLILAIFAFGGALRARLWIERELRQHLSDSALRTDY